MSGLASNVDGEVQIDGRWLVVDSAGTEMELTDGLDDASVNERAISLDDLDVLGLALFIDGERELNLRVRGNEIVREARGKREYGGAEENRGDDAGADTHRGWGSSVVHGRAGFGHCG